MIFRKIVKIVATRCHILSLKCTKFDFGWDSAPDPAGGARSQRSPRKTPLAGFKGVLLLREGKGDRGREGKGKRGRWEGRGRKGKEGSGRKEINLPHGRLKTLAALTTVILKAVRNRQEPSGTVRNRENSIKKRTMNG